LVSVNSPTLDGPTPGSDAATAVAIASPAHTITPSLEVMAQAPTAAGKPTVSDAFHGRIQLSIRLG
jgi:hypothetical protein